MGTYSAYAGDPDDYTDEEVADFSITAQGSAAIARMEASWQELRAMRRAGGLSAAVVRETVKRAGDRTRAGTLRLGAQEVYALVTAIADGEAVPTLAPWLEDASWLQLHEPHSSVAALASVRKAESEEQIRLIATMMLAVPLYNRRVRKSLFPEALWSFGVKRLCNKVLYRLTAEVDNWAKTIEVLTSNE